MSSRLPAFSGLSALHAVARCGTLSAAAQALNVSQPAISRRIAGLEADLGCTLFDRGSRPLALTVQGQELAATLATSLGQIETTVEHLRRASAEPTISISGPSGFIAFWLIPRLPALSDAFDGVNVRVMTLENDMNTRAGDIDIRFMARREDGSVARKIIGEQVIAAASPWYLSQRGTPDDLATLDAHVLLSLEDNRTWYDWPRWFGRLGMPKPKARREMEFSSYSILVGALLGGQGIGLAWSGLLDSFFDSGALVRVGDYTVESERGYFLSLRDGDRASPVVQEMAEWIAGESDTG